MTNFTAQRITLLSFLFVALLALSTLASKATATATSLAPSEVEYAAAALLVDARDSESKASVATIKCDRGSGLKTGPITWSSPNEGVGHFGVTLDGSIRPSPLSHTNDSFSLIPCVSSYLHSSQLHHELRPLVASGHIRWNHPGGSGAATGKETFCLGIDPESGELALGDCVFNDGAEQGSFWWGFTQSAVKGRYELLAWDAKVEKWLTWRKTLVKGDTFGVGGEDGIHHLHL